MIRLQSLVVTLVLLGVTISQVNPLTARFVDAQNTFYGRPDLPIGVTHDPTAQKRESRYLKLADSPDDPHDLRRNEDAREAVDRLRELLPKQPDQSVSLISVGIASNMANLLKSKGDAHSPLDGTALIRRVPNSLNGKPKATAASIARCDIHAVAFGLPLNDLSSSASKP